MKRWIAIGISLLYALVANAQAPGNDQLQPQSAYHKNYDKDGWKGRDGRHNRRMDRPRIHYTADQRKQMNAIAEEYQNKSAELMKNDNMTLKEYKSQLLALQKDRKNKMLQLLTQDQRDQLAKWKVKAYEDAQVRAAARLERMRIEFQLTKDQTVAIQNKQADFRSKFQAIRNNENLLSFERREELKALASNQKEAIKSVLTPDQASKLDSMRPNLLRAK